MGILAAMLACALGAMALLVWLVRGGQSGLALMIMSIAGAAFAILIYAASRPFGIDPLFAMSLALVVALPLLLGGGAGALLGWLLRRKDDKSGTP